MPTQRYKTKAEFIREYGFQWRYGLPFGWAKQYDEYFGKPTISDRIARMPIQKTATTAELDIEGDKQYLLKVDPFTDKVTVKSHQTPEGFFIGNIIIRNDTNGPAGFFINSCPNGNCQTASIIYFNNILDRFNDTDIVLIFKHLTHEYPEFMRRQLTFDVHRKYDTRLKFYNPTICVPYTSSNSTLMISGLIEISKLPQ